MTIKNITIYVANDGAKFASEEECRKYESKISYLAPTEIYAKAEYSLCSIVSDPRGGGLYHAIFYRETSEDFVCCICYNTDTGEYEHEIVCADYNDALDCLVTRIISSEV